MVNRIVLPCGASVMMNGGWHQTCANLSPCWKSYAQAPLRFSVRKVEAFCSCFMNEAQTWVCRTYALHYPETLSLGAYMGDSGSNLAIKCCISVVQCFKPSSLLCVLSLQKKMIPARPTRACMVGAVWPWGRDTVAFALRAIRERAARSVSGLRERSGLRQKRSRTFEGAHSSSGSALEFMRRTKIGYKTTEIASFEGYSFDPWCRTNEYDY